MSGEKIYGILVMLTSLFLGYVAIFFTKEDLIILIDLIITYIFPILIGAGVIYMFLVGLSIFSDKD